MSIENNVNLVEHDGITYDNLIQKRHLKILGKIQGKVKRIDLDQIDMNLRITGMMYNPKNSQIIAYTNITPCNKI